MNCPVCDDMRMKEVEKNGVLVDICPNCKGVWLDRGELEKLLSEVREVQKPFNDWYQNHYEPKPQVPPQQPQSPPAQHGNPAAYPKHDPYYGSGYGYGYKKKKKHSVFDVFEDLFG